MVCHVHWPVEQLQCLLISPQLNHLSGQQAEQRQQQQSHKPISSASKFHNDGHISLDTSTSSQNLKSSFRSRAVWEEIDAERTMEVPVLVWL